MGAIPRLPKYLTIATAKLTSVDLLLMLREKFGFIFKVYQDLQNCFSFCPALNDNFSKYIIRFKMLNYSK